MKRVWVVDNAVPVQELDYVPPTLANEGIRYLLERHGDAWEDMQVKELCDSLSADAYDLTVIASPQQLLRQLHSGVEPPHAVIFDWEGPGFGEQVNRETIIDLLQST